VTLVYQLRCWMAEWIFGKLLDLMPSGPHRALLACYAAAYAQNLLLVQKGSPARYRVNEDSVDKCCTQIAERERH